MKPVYELSESPEAWGLTAHLPGVTKEGLELTVEDGLITIRGRRGWALKWKAWTAYPARTKRSSTAERARGQSLIETATQTGSRLAGKVDIAYAMKAFEELKLKALLPLMYGEDE